MDKNRIFLGITKEEIKGTEYLTNEPIRIYKHKWECNWYWGFGYIGNQHLQTHFKGELLGRETQIDKIFKKPHYTQEDWWLIRDLFKQAYALQKCAEVYLYGGHQTTRLGVSDIIKSEEMNERLNKDLEIVLNKVWDILENNRI